MSGLNNFNPGNKVPTSAPNHSVPQLTSIADPDETPAEMTNLNQRHADDAPALFRDDEIHQLVSILIGSFKPNALLIGDPGTGKTRIVEDLARRLEDPADTSLPRQLNGSIIYELSINDMISGTMFRGALEEKLKKILKYVEDHPETILFIDEIHQLFQSSNQAMMGGLVESLKPAMARGDIRIIGATTTTEAKTVMDNPAFARRMTKLNINELTLDQSETIMSKALPALMDHYGHKLTITEQTLSEINRIADRDRLAHQHRPDVGLTLLDRTMADTLTNHQRALTQATQAGNQDLADALAEIQQVTVIARQAEQTLRTMTTGSATIKPLDLTALRDALRALHGQDEPLDTLVTSLRRHRLGINRDQTQRPLSWMLAGPSGVGKTQTAKIISEYYSNHAPIILNMTEYNTEMTINKLIGSPSGYVGYESRRDTPFTSILTDPYQVIVLDEIEKAHPNVQRLFYRVLDEGKLTDNTNQVIDFSKCIIIATTNAAGDALSKPMTGFGVSTPSPTHTLDALNASKTFDAAFLSRFSLVTGYNPISRETYEEILSDTYLQLVSTLEEDQQMLLPDALPADVRAQLALGYTRDQGARTALRAVEGYVADVLLSAEDL